MTTAFVFVIGAMLGSFLNVVIHRLPRHESLVVPGSRCPHCGTPIRAWDNIPLFSFVILGGRCRACRRPISVRYPFVELTAAMLVTASWLRTGSIVDFVAAAAFSLILLAIFFIDLEHQIVPNALTYPGLALGLLLALPQGRIVDALLTAAAAGAFFLLIAIVSRGGMGGGDIKLAAMMGAFLGWPAITVALLTAFTGGAAAGLLLIGLRRRSRKDPIPFGPALAVGGIIALYGAGGLIRWYLGS
jgi:leader peptidase (prepilin peptidase)/N-methyltransferase